MKWTIEFLYLNLHAGQNENTAGTVMMVVRPGIATAMLVMRLHENPHST